MAKSDSNIIAKKLSAELSHVRAAEEGELLITPLLYPGGDLVSVLPEKTETGFVISDRGAACREADLIDEYTDFSRYAQKACAYYRARFNEGTIEMESCSEKNLLTGIIAVANATKMAPEKFTEAVSRKRLRDEKGRFVSEKSHYETFTEETAPIRHSV